MSKVEELKQAFIDLIESAEPIGKSEKEAYGKVIAGKFEVYGWRLNYIGLLIRDLEIEEIQKGSVWRHGYYYVPIKKGSTIHEQLGVVTQTNDKRWKWIRNYSEYHDNGYWNGANQQGCETTEQEAMNKVLEGWKL